MDLQLIVLIGGKVNKISCLNISTHSFFSIGICLELLLTFVFITIILMVTIDNKSKNIFAPVYIGITLFVCILASFVYFIYLFIHK